MNTEYPIFLGSEIDQPDPDNAMFHVLPVPFEKTVSYGGGTGKGPAAILDASWQLEEWDGKSKPCDAGIYTCEPVDCSVDAATVIDNIATATAKIVRHGVAWASGSCERCHTSRCLRVHLQPVGR